MRASINQNQLAEQLNSILESSNIKQTFQAFIKKFKSNNIPFIYQAIASILKALHHKKPQIIFNGLIATRMVISTLEYVPITLVQIYLLPIILQIVTRSNLYIQNPSYFIQGQYSSQIQSDIVLLAIQLVYTTAAIKPYRTLRKIQLAEDSQYKKAKQTLMKKDIYPNQMYTFFNNLQVNQFRRHYLEKLNLFKPEQYVCFFKELVCNEMNNNIKPDLESRQLFLYGDAFVTVCLLDTCEQELSNMHNNFVNKIRYLYLIDYFIRQGDIYAILIITKCQFLQNIRKQIQKAHGQRSLEEGASIFQDIQASSSDKQQFYVQFLKCMNIWAVCHPFDETREPTDVNRIYHILKHQKHFIFPQNREINIIKSEMIMNLKLNKVRNQQLIKIIGDQHSQLILHRSSFYQAPPIAVSKISSAKILDTQVQKMMLQVKSIFPLMMQRKKLQLNKLRLQKCKSWLQERIKQYKQQEDKSFQEIYLCLKTIEIILSSYNLYHQAKLSFQDYQERIRVILSTKDNCKSETSLENKLTLQDCHSPQLLSFNQSIILSIQGQYERNVEILFDKETKKQQQSIKSDKSQINSSLNRESSTKTKMKNNRTKHQFNQPNYHTNHDYYDSQMNLQSNKNQIQPIQKIKLNLKNLSSSKNNLSASMQQKIKSSLIKVASQSIQVQSYHEDYNLQTRMEQQKLFNNCFQVTHDTIGFQQYRKKLMKYSKDGNLINIVGTSPKGKRETKVSHNIIDEKRLLEKYLSLHKNSIQTERLCSKIKSLSLLQKEKRIRIALEENKLQTKNSFQYKQFAIQQRQLYARSINTGIYKHCFPQSKQYKTKKSMLMAKSVVLKDNQFQIGCISSRKGEHLEIAFFITPLRDSVQDIKAKVICQGNIEVTTNTKQIGIIKVNCQQRISLQCHLNKIPYILPIFDFDFKYRQEQQHRHLLIPIPCSFNKFLNYQSILQEDWNIFNSNDHKRIKTQKFTYNQKIIGRQKIKECLNNFTLIGRDEETSYFLIRAQHSNNQFLIQVIFDNCSKMHIQAINIRDNTRELASLQFLLATFRHMFEIQEIN